MHPSISIFPNLDGPNVKHEDYEHSFLQGAMFGPYSFSNIDGREDPGRSKRNLAELTVIIEMLHSLREGTELVVVSFYHDLFVFFVKKSHDLRLFA